MNKKKNHKPLLIVLGIVGGVIILIAITIFTIILTEGIEFSNQIYAECIDSKVEKISINSLYSDSYNAVKSCQSKKNRAIFKKYMYDKCIKNENEKIGKTLESYNNYLKENGGSITYRDKSDALYNALLKAKKICFNKI